MGMFDYVNVEMPCPKCGALLKGTFQSKDRDCRMDCIEPTEVWNLYTQCRCKQRVEFSRPMPPVQTGSTSAPWSREQIEALGFVLRSLPAEGESN